MLKKTFFPAGKTLQVCISFVPAGARRTIKERHGTPQCQQTFFFSKSNFTGDQVSLGKMLNPKLPLMIPLVSECV